MSKKQLSKAINNAAVGAMPCACPIVECSILHYLVLSKQQGVFVNLLGKGDYPTHKQWHIKD